MALTIEKEVIRFDVTVSKAKLVEGLDGEDDLGAIEAHLDLGEHVTLHQHCGNQRMRRGQHKGGMCKQCRPVTKERGKVFFFMRIHGGAAYSS